MTKHQMQAELDRALGDFNNFKGCSELKLIGQSQLVVRSQTGHNAVILSTPPMSGYTMVEVESSDDLHRRGRVMLGTLVVFEGMKSDAYDVADSLTTAISTFFAYKDNE